MEKCKFAMRITVSLLVLEYCTSLECHDEGTTSVIKVNITCDEYLEFYVDGHRLGSGNADAKNKSYLRYEIAAGSHVVALKCRGRDSVWSGGILGSFDDGQTTDTTWKCTTDVSRGWNTRTYQDDSWPMATSYGPNNGSTFPWGGISSINGKASWIWTNDNKNDIEIYCRHNLVTPCTEVRSNFFHTTDSFRDISVKGFLLFVTIISSETECALRCGQFKTCASFNVQYTRNHGLQVCELNTESIRSQPRSKVARQGFQYYERVQIYY